MKIDYEDWIDEDPFHPCLKCGANDFELNMTTGLWSCSSCGEAMVAPKEPIRKKKVNKKKVRLDSEDWE